MARAVVGGLITSTLLTLIVVPVVYTHPRRHPVRGCSGAGGRERAVAACERCWRWFAGRQAQPAGAADCRPDRRATDLRRR